MHSNVAVSFIITKCLQFGMSPRLIASKRCWSNVTVGSAVIYLNASPDLVASEKKPLSDPEELEPEDKEKLEETQYVDTGSAREWWESIWEPCAATAGVFHKEKLVKTRNGAGGGGGTIDGTRVWG